MDYTPEQVAEINKKWGAPLKDREPVKRCPSEFSEEGQFLKKIGKLILKHD